MNFFTFLAYLPKIKVRIKRPSSLLSPFLKPGKFSDKFSDKFSGKFFAVQPIFLINCLVLD